MSSIDYTKYYDLEGYLFGELTERFHQEKTRSAEDFFCIIIWKANRSKSKIAKRLLAHGPYVDLSTVVQALMANIVMAEDARGRLEVLIKNWGFLLPMASAILTVLYPDEFTVYDIRVCNALGDFHDAQNKSRFDDLWKRYCQYIECVIQTVPQKASLRDKDRYLWGKSFYDQLLADIINRFVSPSFDVDTEFAEKDV